MSMGLNALRGVIDSQSLTAFRSLKREWFLEEEEEAFDFIRDHFRRYNSLPDIKTVKENGIDLKVIRQPLDYYIDRLSERAIFNAVNDRFSLLTDAMRSKRGDDIKAALRDIIQSTRIVDNRQDYSTLAEQAMVVLQNYRDAKSNPGMQGITLGNPLLDEVTNGAQGGDLIVLAGRPNIGKSYKLLHMMHSAWKAGHPCSCVSMEMTTMQLAQRFIGMESGINPDLIRKGQLSTSIGEPVFTQSIHDVQNRPPIHFLEGNFRKSVADVNNMAQEFNPDILFVDAGYLLAPERQSKSFSKRDQISATMEELKSLAQDRNIPVVTSVQFNREVKKGDKKAMDVSQLAETDVIGQIATLVIGMKHGRAPYEDITREYQLIKNREGALITYQGKFSFNPMNFSYLPGSEALDQDNPDGYSGVVRENDEMLEAAGWER